MARYKGKLLQRLWNADCEYYASARQSSEGDIHNHQGLQVLAEICRHSDSILDCGCGEGTKLSRLTQHNQAAHGLDISPLAIRLGKAKYPQLRLLTADLENGLPFPADCFGCVYMAFAAEHLSDPDRAVDELIRVARPGGWVAILSPNFGSPFFPSPCTAESFRRRWVRRILKTHLCLVTPQRTLGWEEVTPRMLIEGQWQSDWDTTVEPYVHTLMIALKNRGVRVEAWSSMWGQHPRSTQKWWQLIRRQKGEAMRQLCHMLGEKGIPPYSHYGPNFFVVGQKTKTHKNRSK